MDREHGGIIYTYMYIQYIDYIYIHVSADNYWYMANKYHLGV